MKRRYFSFFGILGFALLLISEGFQYRSYNGVLNIALSPLSLVSWIMFLISSLSIEFRAGRPNGNDAPWWRKSVAFLYDANWLFCILLIPINFLVLISYHGSLPPPWEIVDGLIEYRFIEFLLFIFVFLSLWAAVGLCLSPNIRTPGMMLTNIDLSVDNDVSKSQLCTYGVFAYYGVFIPFFNAFSKGISPKGVCCE